MKKEKITEDGYEFDSNEELYFYWWVKELIEAGFIEKYVPHPTVYNLSEELKLPYHKPMKRVAAKEMWKTIINGHEYTPDAGIVWNDNAVGIFTYNLDQSPYMHLESNVPTSRDYFDKIVSKRNKAIIEVKPAFDQNNMTRLAIINQKWVLDKYNKFVNIIVPQKLFNETFTPKRYLLTNLSGKKREIKFKVRTLEEFVTLKKNNQIELL